jgi:hypothetical protein
MWDVFSDLRDVQRKLQNMWDKEAREVARSMPFRSWEAQLHSVLVRERDVTFDMAIRTRASTQDDKEEALRQAAGKIERENALLRNVELVAHGDKDKDMVWVARGEFRAHLVETVAQQTAE